MSQIYHDRKDLSATNTKKPPMVVGWRSWETRGQKLTVLPPMARPTLEPTPTNIREMRTPAYDVAFAEPMLLMAATRVKN
jgi:hypothetical protein